uniref:asparagine synthase (glutamine-hydrolyzing) n=1 Tax=Rubrivivax gelatinosus S1 TaxID=1138313 RepID=L8BA78_RUBGE|nr:putative Asparagine synthase (glutamine-hydrolyzing) [Rubrivivax gelatinosus S1]
MTCAEPPGICAEYERDTRAIADSSARLLGPEATAGDLDGVHAARLAGGGLVRLYRAPSGLATLFYRADACGLGDTGGVLAPLGRGRIDRQGLLEYLRFGDIVAPRTIAAGVRAVEPGHRVTVGAGAPRSEALAWGDEERPKSFEDAVARLDRLLSASVRQRLLGAGRPAAFLSGGVDSALLCAVAARTRPDLVAVTVGFDGEGFDETPVAARIATHLGLRHEVLRFSREALVGALERVARESDQPSADPSTPATLLAFEHCRARYDAVLDGSGADEALGAVPPRHVRLAAGVFSQLPRGLRLAIAGLSRRAGRLAAYRPLVDFDHPADTMLRWRCFTRAEIESLVSGPVSFEDSAYYRRFAALRHGDLEGCYSALQDLMPLDRVSQALRATGVPLRLPFYDPRVQALLRDLPKAWRHQPGDSKRVLRALLEREVPRVLWDQPKHGFNFPLEDFLRGADAALVREHLGPSRWAAYGLLEPDGVQHLARRFLEGDSALTFRVWSLVVLGSWLDQHPELR